ncbi:MAG: aromatic ring-hydroxylating dioxygenase subunit alpha [Pseudomonadota bacterium]
MRRDSQNPTSSTSSAENLRALGADYYVSDEVFAEEKEKLFFKSWQYVCHISQLQEPGSYVTANILGQNVFVVRDQGGEISGYCNICPHRGHKLLEGAGRKSVIVCPYHHWSFSLDGSLRGMRSMASSHAPEREDVCLFTVRVDRLLDFIFVNLDRDALPIADFWPGVEDHIRETCPDAGDYVMTGTAAAIHQVDVNANWKVQIDNYLECQHCRHGHVTFTDLLDINNQYYLLNKNSAYNFIPGSGKEDNLAYPIDLKHDRKDLHFWFLFPNVGISQFAGPPNLTLFQWNPISPDRAFRQSINLEVAEPTDPGMRERQEKRTIWGRDVLQPEDISFLLSVQEGMKQRCFDNGWYIVDWDNIEFSEAMMRHFHDTYLEHMGHATASPRIAAE